MTATDTKATADRTSAVHAGRDAVADATSGLAETLDTLRATAGGVGERLPEVFEAIRVSANEGARTVQAWPDLTQRLAASFSLGLGLGLTLAGAPRIIAFGTLLPAIAATAAIVGRDRRDGRPTVA